MTTTTNKAIIGSISTGTLQRDHLTEVFAQELRNVRPDGDTAHASLLIEATTILADREPYGHIIDNLIDALNEYAPPFCYFGTLEGDGADFGFWPDHTAIQELIDEGAEIDRGPNGEATYVNYMENVVISTNDHGNITISKFEIGETLLSIV